MQHHYTTYLIIIFVNDFDIVSICYFFILYLRNTGIDESSLLSTFNVNELNIYNMYVYMN